MYECSRCSGNGKICFYNHVMAGVCFQCGGSGLQKTKPIVSKKFTVVAVMVETNEIGVVYNLNAKNENDAVCKAIKKAKSAPKKFSDKFDFNTIQAVDFYEFHS